MKLDMQNRNIDSRNFGCGSSDLGKALFNAYKNTYGNSFASLEASKSAFNSFKEHLKGSGIKDLKNVTRDDVAAFKDKLEGNGKSASTVQNYISFVNQAMTAARNDKECYVSAVKELDAEKRSGIATVDKSICIDQHNQMKAILGERLAAQLDIQRELGLRFKESCLINPSSALIQAKDKGSIVVERGTKGGRPREIPITNQKQINVLENAAKVQGSDRSMIPSNMTYKEYRQQAYSHKFSFHGERHYYANTRYQQLTGCKSPVKADVQHSQRFQYIAKTLGVSLKQARDIDHRARLQIAKELGHERIEITNAYLG